MLIGQDRAASILARAISQDRVSHAYLFVGPAGVGKHTAAVLFAQALNCERLTDEFTTETRRHGGRRGYLESGEAALRPRGDVSVVDPSSPSGSVSPCLRGEPLRPCGVCESCRRIEAGTHPDVHVILPGSKGGQNISVEQVRDIRQDVARRPIMGRRKVYLMPTAEAMNEEAANTLLKTLEEPPDYVTLILMAASPTRVLPTVLSRCQVVPFGLVPAEVTGEWLTRTGIDSARARSLAYAAGGRPGLALRWSREPEALDRRRQVLELLDEVASLPRRGGELAGEAIVALRWAERARGLIGPEDAETPAPSASARAGEEATAGSRTGVKPLFFSLVELIRTYYRDLLLLSQGAPETLLWNGDHLTALLAAVEQYTPRELLACLEAVDRCRQFLDRNVAPQLALETLFLELTLTESRPTATTERFGRY